MFRGATKVTLDDKGRMVLPTVYREQMPADAQGKLVITLGSAKCLVIYPQPEWEQVERKLMSLPSLHPQTERLKGLMLGHAMALELDSHSRVLLTAELREVASLQRHAMLVGQGNSIQLWDEALWIERRTAWLTQDSGEMKALPAELEALRI
jgi:MraZ protein